MAFIIDRADSVALMLERFTTADGFMVAGQFANLEFWVSETLHALEALDDYQIRFERLSEAQRTWIREHDVVVGSYCPMCDGQCEFGPGFKPPRPPTKIPSTARNNASRRLKDAFYFFVLRCFRMELLDAKSVQEIFKRVGTSVESRDLVRK